MAYYKKMSQEALRPTPQNFRWIRFQMCPALVAMQRKMPMQPCIKFLDIFTLFCRKLSNTRSRFSAGGLLPGFFLDV